MSKRLRDVKLPLRNISSNLNSSASSRMSFSNDSGFSPLTNSPMSSLAFNLSELSTGRTTPRRRLSLSGIDTPPFDESKPTTDRTLSAESGCFSASPPTCSPTFDSLDTARLTSALHPDIPIEAFSAKKKTIAFRRISSEPIPALRLDSPTDFLDDKEDDEVKKEEGNGRVDWPEEGFSQDSGLGMDNERKTQSLSSFEDLMASSSSLSNPSSLPSLEDIWNMEGSDFKAPKGKPPKRQRSVTEDRLINEDTCSPIKYSPVKSSLPRPSFASSLFSKSKSSSDIKKDGVLRKPSLDDGFQEVFDIEDLQNEANDQIATLISATLLHRPVTERTEEISAVGQKSNAFIKRVQFSCADQDGTPSSRPAASKRYLKRSQSLDLRPRPIFKRTEPPEDLSDCVQSNKRWRGEESNLLTVVGPGSDSKTSPRSPSWMIPSVGRIQRSHSETEAMIKSAVSRMASEPGLIGDCSKPYCLPTIKGKHQDLKAISPETVSRLLAHEFDNEVEEFHILDCRYPYEYEGGHIQTATNIYTREGVIDKYLKSPLTAKDPKKRFILIFHCEFSSERAPNLSRFLRRHDRESNKECYPFLHYPEIYLLEGGYKNFFEQHQDLCEPKLYRTMLDKNHSDDLRKFRAKSKSWAGEKTSRPGFRNLKF